ncbi:MAG: GLPGLI family protein [Prevotellaceae bacterium]|jgi:GLPGLI family protein|nr:GLPGLI family protein [Prevotellaceae bacterium]
MKRKILITALLCAASLHTAKSQTLQVIYETQPKMQINADMLDKNLIEQIAKNSKTKSLLCYNNGESILKPIKKENENASSGINIKINSPEDVTYKNHNTNKEISYKDFFGKGFLIESELKKEKYELTDSTKNIQGYTCTKAILKNGEKETAVWFCPNLPVKDGPVYTGLDGLVLEMVSDNLTVVATEILIDATEDCQIIAPAKGKKISRDEFDKMVEKRMKALEQSDNSDGGMVIKITK